jgi:hypothetical protein
MIKNHEPAERATAAGRFARSMHFLLLILGLTPQALCCRSLRELRSCFANQSNGSYRVI